MAMRKGQRVQRKTSIGLRAKAWWVLRKNRVVTLAELQLTLCDGSETQAASNLGKWLRRLRSVGIVRVDRIKDPAGGCNETRINQYTLSRDLGPLAPVIQQVSWGYQVYDPNSGKIITGDSDE